MIDHTIKTGTAVKTFRSKGDVIILFEANTGDRHQLVVGKFVKDKAVKHLLAGSRKIQVKFFVSSDTKYCVDFNLL